MPLLPLSTLQPVQSLSACTRVHCTYLFITESRPITDNKLEKKWTKAINLSEVAGVLISNTSRRPIGSEGTVPRILSFCDIWEW